MVLGVEEGSGDEEEAAQVGRSKRRRVSRMVFEDGTSADIEEEDEGNLDEEDFA